MPYREPNGAELGAFANHITIAETLFGATADLQVQLDQEWDSDLYRSYLLGWTQLWEQLDRARLIALRFGRDLSRVEAAQRRANPYSEDALVTLAHRAATLTAFAEVRRCFPEVVVPTAIPTTTRPPRRRFQLPPGAWYALGTLAALLVFLAERGCS